jgi:hypothetical protein
MLFLSRIIRAFVVSAICVIGMSLRAESPREFADRFYRNCTRWKIRGVPTSEERRRISPFFSTEILRLYRIADRQRAEFERRHPIDPKQPLLALKPPWCKEGDPFSGTDEGVSAFAIGNVTRVNGLFAVRINLEYTIGGKSYPWTDLLLLDRAGKDWVIADIRFKDRNSLVENMREGIAAIDEEMQTKRE